MALPPDWVNISLQRPNYFAGQYLLAQDFELAHQYLSDRQRYINSRLHLAGIVEGLEVEAIAGQPEVLVKSGTAIDGVGNLVILTEATTRPIHAAGWLCLRYHQELKLLQQQDSPDSFTRFEEVPSLTLEAVESNDAKTILLAKVSLENGLVKIDSTVRQYSGLRLPNGNEDIVLQSSGDALTIKGTLSIAGTLQFGETTIAGISEKIDGAPNPDSNSEAPPTHYIPSEKAIKDHLELRLFERMAEQGLPTQEKPTIGTEPGPDGKLYGWKTEGGSESDPYAVIKLISYTADQAAQRLSIERDTGTLAVNGRIRARHIESTNPMRHRMYPSDPLVYQDIFDARDKAKVISKHGEPNGYNDTSHNSASNLWNGRRMICFGYEDAKDAGALITIPEGYTTVWVRVPGDQWYEFKADFIDGKKEDLGYWTAGFRQGNCYCPDGSLTDGCSTKLQWLPIAAGRSGKLRLLDKTGSNGNGGLWFSGVAFSKNPWAHATQSAVGYYWGSNGGDKADQWSGQADNQWKSDVMFTIPAGSNRELRVPYVWSGRDKLLYIVEHNNNWNGCMHNAITVNGQPVGRLMAGYNNPFSRHWNSKWFNRYIAVRIPADLIPKPTAEAPPLLKVKIDMTKQDNLIHFREIGTHDLELPYYP